MKKEEEKKVEETVDGPSECSKDSDCDKGCVCVRGKCVQDITPPEES